MNDFNIDITKYEKLSNYAFSLVAKKRYTSFEMDKKLNLYVKKRDSYLSPENYISKIMARLNELNYMDDYKFARDYVSDRAKFRPRGIFLLKKELMQKGLCADTIDKAIFETNIDEYPLAVKLIHKKEKKWADLSISKQRNKAYQFLSSKGFASDTIYRAVDSCYNRSS